MVNIRKVNNLSKTSLAVSYFFVFIITLVLTPFNLYSQDFPDLPENSWEMTIHDDEPYAETNYDETTTETLQQPQQLLLPPPPPAPVRLAQKVVMIGRVPYMSIKEMMNHVQGLLRYLKKEMGVKEVRLVTSKNYSGVIEALARGTIDFAWLGPTAYVIGQQKIRMIPLVKTKRRPGSSYRGVFITLKSSQIMGIEDIRNKRIGFVDPESASGYLYPLYILKRSKINPFKECKKVEFLKRHDSVLNAVITGKIDVGVCLEDTLKLITDQKIKDNILILGKTDEIPSDVIACREDCSPVLRDKFVEALLKMGKTSSPKSGTHSIELLPEFLPVSDNEFDVVRNILIHISDINQAQQLRQ